ncbi:MAG: GxxExxY protein [Novosphingobium sp.]|uniref:GxxExxY protein n=1 Tax=Novosphingobium sp. TaxID=1874826 RepID=UPI003019C04F
MEIDEVSAEIVNAAIRLHKRLGPGLLESVYEVVLAGVLIRAGLKVERQRAIDIEFDGLHFPGAFRADLVVQDCLVVEIKSVETLQPVHGKQLLTYLRLLQQPVGLLLNFGGATMKEGIRRVVNDYRPSNPSAPPRLRVKHEKGEQDV